MKNDENSVNLSRRDFFKELGMIGGGGALLSAFPWLQSCSADDKVQIAKEKVRIGFIGTGSRGQYHLNNLKTVPYADVVALCDNYPPNLKAASVIYPQAKTYDDYRKVLEDKDIQAVMIATPLYEHAHITIDALHAGKHVFCEKSMAMTCADCLDMYNVFKESGKVMFIGQQRLYDPKYIKAMEMVHAGLLGDINSIRAYWFRNNDWRRPVPSPDLERKINWRLYKEYSCGLVTELATHQLQVGNWALRMLPEKVAGMGDIVYWKDGREVYDSINLIYHYPNGVKMTYESMIANKFYGLEEEIMGSKGTMEPEKGKYYFEDVGLRNARLNYRQIDGGHLMENIIYNELRIRGYSIDVGQVEVRITNDDGKKMRKLLEVDFICNSGDKRVYIQSALDMPTQEKIDQETNSLRHIKDGFPKIVIVGGLTPSHVNTDGISIINIIDFLKDTEGNLL